MIPNSDRDTGLGRSRLPGRTTAGNWSGISDGLVGPELKLDTDWVSESSSDTKLLQLSSSKASEATRGRERAVRGSLNPPEASAAGQQPDKARELQSPCHRGDLIKGLTLPSLHGQTVQQLEGKQLGPTDIQCPSDNLRTPVPEVRVDYLKTLPKGGG